MERAVLVLAGLLCTCPFSSTLWAAPVTARDAELVVGGWLKLDSAPLETPVGQTVLRVETFSDTSGAPTYHVVDLLPAGFVIVSADDLIEPIIAFAGEGRYDASRTTALGALVGQDLPARLASARSTNPGVQGVTMNTGASWQAKWRELQNAATTVKGRVSATGLASVSDVRVAPLTKTKWGQSNVVGAARACSNYYTPQLSSSGTVRWWADDSANYVCGCVATAMAQLMYYHRQPTVKLDTERFYEVDVLGVPQNARVRGGDGAGGSYRWDLMGMALAPNSTTSQDKREAIGTLCYDAAISVNMSWVRHSDGSVGASSNLFWAKAAFNGIRLSDAVVPTTFHYANAIWGANFDQEAEQFVNLGAGLRNMINPNLDAGYPVILGIQGPDGGHAVLADGYGYNQSTLYHHLNIGADTSQEAANVWYNLDGSNDYASPRIDIDLSPNQGSSYDFLFDSITQCLYNVFPAKTGEIISGRVTNSAGAPIRDATITTTVPLSCDEVMCWGGYVIEATTNDKGIYALIVPPSAEYVVTATKFGDTFAPRTVTVGRSQDGESNSGNIWGFDFQGQNAAPAPVSITSLNINGGSVTQTLSNSGRTDWYRFVVSATGQYLIDYITSAQLNTYLYGPDSWVTPVPDSQYGPYGVVLSPGTYYIRAEASGANSATYSIRVLETTDARYLSVGGFSDWYQSLNGSWFVFVAWSSRSYTIQTKGTDTCISLYGPGSRSKYLTEDDDYERHTGSCTIVRSLSAGVYFINASSGRSGASISVRPD